MRKSRLVPLTVALLIVALCYWAWWERDRVAPVLVNSLIEGGRVESVHGLQLTSGRIDIKRLELALENGAVLHLEKVRLLHPLSLLFSRDQNRTQVTIDELNFVLPKAEVAGAPAQVSNGKQRKSPFKLSDTLQVLHQYLPERLHITELHQQGVAARSGSLNLHRDRNKGIINADLLSGDQQLSLRIQPLENQLILVAHLSTVGQSPALSLRGGLTRVDSETWRTNVQLESDLQRITGLPLSRSLNDIAASASGKLTASVELALPDEVFQPRAYRDITAKLHSESVHLTLPKALLGVPAVLSLSTDAPVELALTSLQPLQAERIAGSATVTLAPTGQPMPLFDLQVETRTAEEKPSLDVAGTLNLEAAAPILTAPRWQKFFKTIKLDSPSGTLRFGGTAKVKPLRDYRDINQHWLSDITFTLLPESHARFGFTTGLQKDSLPAQLGWHKGKADVHILSAMSLQIADWPGDVLLTDGTAALQLTAEGGDELKSQLQQVDCAIAEETRCSLNLTVATGKLVRKSDNLSIFEPKVATQLDFTLRADRQRWQFRQTEFSAQKISRDDIEIELLSLDIPQLECTLAVDKPVCTSPELITSFSKLKGDEMTASGSVRFEDVQFRQDERQSQISSGYRSDNLKLTAKGRYRLEPLLTGKLSLSGNTLRGENQLQAGILKAQAQWHHDLDTAKGNVEFSVANTEFSQQQPLSNSVEGLPLDFVAGTLSATGRYSWPQAQRDTINVELNDVAAVYGDSFATGVHARLALTRPEESWISVEPRPVRIDTLDVGLPVKGIQFIFTLDEKQDLKLSNLGAELLGGKLQSEALVWNLNGEERSSLILLSDISLRELARETEAENFAATGILDLKIPLITGADGVTVEHGTVQARPPGGRLRYYGAFSAQMLSSNPQLKLIAGALEDYNYREMSGTLEYPPSGDMQLQLKLVGRSESVDAERDLIINLNLENNIPAMLRSLQASRDLTETLEKHIQ